MNTFYNYQTTKYFTFILALAFLNITNTYCQNKIELPKGKKVKVTGTGQTTGHIADLSIFNDTDEEYKTSLGPFYIPSSGKYQPYIVPAQINVTVPPGATINIPLAGYCTDIHKPPVGSGEDLPPVTSWIIPDMITDQWEPDEKKGWVPVIISVQLSEEKGENLDNIVTLIPGTDQPLTHTIDQYKYPGATAPVFLKAIDLIITSFDSLKNINNILTPFSGNPEKEREAVIQQTFWIFTSGISGDEYTKDQFEAKMTGQLENQTGKSITMIPKESKEKFDQGVDDFWNAFNLVGAEAKVMMLAEEPSHMVQNKDGEVKEEGKATGKADSDDEKKPKCKCTKFTGKISTDRGLKESVEIAPDMTKVNPEQKIVYPRVDFEAPKDKTKPEEFSVTFSDLKLECDCETGKCEMLAAENDKFGKDEKYSISIEQITSGVSYEGSSKVKSSGSHEYKFKSTEKSDDIKISFKLTSYCKSDECDKKMCKATIVLSFKDEGDNLKK